jgi:predicted O-methyltransferase YrrM
VEPVSATSLTRQPEMAAKVTEYSTEHSEDTSPQMKQLWDWTCTQFGDSDKMSSPLQGVVMKFLAEQLRAKRGMFRIDPNFRLSNAVLEIGCYTGFSALAWYEATEATHADIVTLELDAKMIAASRKTFDAYNLNDRVTLIEGPAQGSLEKLTGQFDIVFVDANKEGYQDYVRTVLDRKLLSPQGMIMCDNGACYGSQRDRLSNLDQFLRVG